MNRSSRYEVATFALVAGRRIRAVFFDLDGTLVESREAWQRVVCDAATHFGAPPVSAESFAAGWGQGIERDAERWFPGVSVEALESFVHAHFLDHREHVRADPDAGATLDAVRTLLLPTALVTNTPGALARAVIAHTGLRLDVVVGGRDAPRSKPAPDLVWLAAQRLGVRAEESLLVGDTVFDRQAAHAAGALFAGFGIEGDLTLARLSDLADSLLPPQRAEPGRR